MPNMGFMTLEGDNLLCVCMSTSKTATVIYIEWSVSLVDNIRYGMGGYLWLLVYVMCGSYQSCFLGHLVQLQLLACGCGHVVTPLSFRRPLFSIKKLFCAGCIWRERSLMCVLI